MSLPVAVKLSSELSEAVDEYLIYTGKATIDEDNPREGK